MCRAKITYIVQNVDSLLEKNQPIWSLKIYESTILVNYSRINQLCHIDIKKNRSLRPGRTNCYCYCHVCLFVARFYELHCSTIACCENSIHGLLIWTPLPPPPWLQSIKRTVYLMLPLDKESDNGLNSVQLCFQY